MRELITKYNTQKENNDSKQQQQKPVIDYLISAHKNKLAPKMYPFVSSQKSKGNLACPTNAVAFESNLSAESVKDE